MFFVRQNATHKIVVGPVVAVGDGFTPVTTLALNTADEAEAILHDNGTVVDISAYTFAAITTADGYYHLTLQSGISGTVGHVTVVINDDSLCLPVKAEFTVVEEAVYDQMFAAAAPGAATTTSAAAIETDTQDIQARLPAALTADGNIKADTLRVGGTLQTAGDLSAQIDAVDNFVDTEVAAIVSELAKVPKSDSNVTWNATALASIQSEANDALVAQNLDHLVKIAVDTDFATTVHLDSVIGQLADAGGTATFDRTTDSLEVLGAATAPSAASIADAVWEEAIADHSGTAGSTAEALNAAGSAGDPWVTALPGAYGAGSAGFILGTNLNATVSSRASQTSVDTIDDLLDTEIAALTTELAKVPKSDGTASWNATALAAIQSEANDALVAYDPPTNAEMEARTLVAANYFDPAADTVTLADGGITRAKLAADTGLQTVRSNTAQSAAVGSITLDASASATNDFYNDMDIYITGGTGAGQVRAILDYVGATKAADIEPNWTTTPDATSTFAILPRNGFVRVHSGTGIGEITITSGAVNALDAAGSALATASALATVDTVVDAILVDTAEIGAAGAGLTEAGGDGDHLTAINLPNQTMDIVGNITGNLSGSVGSVTGNVGGIAGTINTLDALDTAQDSQHSTTQTAIAAIWTTALTEAYRATGATGTAAQLFYEILQNLTEFEISSTTKNVKKLDGSTTAKTYTLNDSVSPTGITETT